MTQESLRELLARLHERLSASGSVDREARALLGTVMRDIERALAAGAHTDPATLAPATAQAPAAGIHGSALRGRPPGARRTAAPAHRRPRQGRHLVNRLKAAGGRLRLSHPSGSCAAARCGSGGAAS